MPLIAPPSPAQAVVLGALVAVAEGIRIWAVGYAGSVTRTRGDRVPSLVCAGPFRYVRNPLYIANIILYVSWALLFGLGRFSALVALYFAVQYSFIVRYEEGLLRAEFGEAYTRYTERVGRWLPSIGEPPASSPHRFQLLASLRSERSTLLAIVLTALACWLKYQLNA